MSVLLLAFALLQAAPADPAPQTTVKGADLTLLADVRQIASDIEEIRGEAFRRPPIAVRVQDDMREVAAEIRAYNTLSRARLEARGRAWADIGLGGPEAPARLLRMLARDLDGIGFDPSGNRLLVSPSILTQSDFDPSTTDDSSSTVLMMTGVRPDEPVVGHLLMHVRQRERAGGDSLEPLTDRLLARAAWAEGEANLVAIRYLFAGMGLADDVIQHSVDPLDVLGGTLFPPMLESLAGVEGHLARFVYLDGFDEVARRHRAGGWAQVDAGRRRGPTTRELMHPERAPRGVAAFDAPGEPPISGARAADEDTIGEQGIVALISFTTNKDNLGLMAGDGWDGDRLVRWEVPSAQPAAEGLTTWITRWISIEEAVEFEYCFGRSLSARFPSQQLADSDVGGRVLRTSERVFHVRRRELEVEIRVAPPAIDARLRATPSTTAP